MAITTQFKGFQKVMDTTGVRAETAMREVIQDLAFEVIQRTPVDTGFLRGNWQVSINVPPTGELVKRGKPEAEYSGASKFPPPAPQTVGRVSVGIAGAEPGDIVYFTNNAEYAAIIENGSSRQRGRAMVKNSIANLDNIADRTIGRIKSLLGL